MAEQTRLEYVRGPGDATTRRHYGHRHQAQINRAGGRQVRRTLERLKRR